MELRQALETNDLAEIDAKATAPAGYGNTRAGY